MAWAWEMGKLEMGWGDGMGKMGEGALPFRPGGPVRMRYCGEEARV